MRTVRPATESHIVMHNMRMRQHARSLHRIKEVSSPAVLRSWSCVVLVRHYPPHVHGHAMAMAMLRPL